VAPIRRWHDREFNTANEGRPDRHAKEHWAEVPSIVLLSISSAQKQDMLDHQRKIQMVLD
jgi:hypothetical protein